MTLDRSRVRAIPLFSSLSDGDADRVAAWAEERKVQTGERLVREGASGYSFFVIEEGTAVVNQDEDRLGALRTGDFFGEVAILDARRRTADVIATSPTRLLVFFGTQFREMESSMPEIADQIRAAMAHRLGAA